MSSQPAKVETVVNSYSSILLNDLRHSFFKLLMAKRSEKKKSRKILLFYVIDVFIWCGHYIPVTLEVVH